MEIKKHCKVFSGIVKRLCLGLLIFSFSVGVFASATEMDRIQIVSTDKDVRSYLLSDDDVSLFVSALQLTKYWHSGVKSDGLTVFVPTNRALRSEGSAFLLKVVLNKPENRQRLDDLMAVHIFNKELVLIGNGTGAIDVASLNAACMQIERSAGSVKIGPEAFVMYAVEASNGYIYYIDRLLWEPYLAEKNC